MLGVVGGWGDGARGDGDRERGRGKAKSEESRRQAQAGGFALSLSLLLREGRRGLGFGAGCGCAVCACGVRRAAAAAAGCGCGCRMQDTGCARGIWQYRIQDARAECGRVGISPVSVLAQGAGRSWSWMSDVAPYRKSYVVVEHLGGGGGGGGFGHHRHSPSTMAHLVSWSVWFVVVVVVVCVCVVSVSMCPYCVALIRYHCDHGFCDRRGRCACRRQCSSARLKMRLIVDSRRRQRERLENGA